MPAAPESLKSAQIRPGHAAAAVPAASPSSPLPEFDMPLVSMRQLLDHAAENGYGIPAFNVNNLEQSRRS